MNIRLKPYLRSTLIIFLSFLLTSTGHLSWMYRLMAQTTAETAYQISTVAGYGAQAIGIILSAVLLRRISLRKVLTAALAGYAACLFPAVLGTTLAATAVFGLLLSILCGIIAGSYLYELTKNTSANHRALPFGVGYGAATIASWLLSLIDGGQVYYGSGVVIICLTMTALTVLTVFIKPCQQKITQAQESSPPTLKPHILLFAAGSAVLLFSLVNNIGFAYSAAEVQNGLHPELSRIFYAVGLTAAGFVTDKSRKYGAVCALAALTIPFVVLALKGEPVSTAVFWALGYFAFGFYAVYRVIVFADIARNRGLLYISGFGLLIGRVGDALGSELYTLLKDSKIVLVAVAAALFIGSVFVFIKLYQLLYLPSAAHIKSEREYFNEFAALHDLSAREREVLHLVLQHQRNPEIAQALFVSESTVKFHVHNLLKKTGCKSRMELNKLYLAQKQQAGPKLTEN